MEPIPFRAPQPAGLEAALLREYGGSMSDTAPESTRSGALNAWDRVPFLAAGLMGTAFLCLRMRLPERIPVHWNGAGEVDRWTTSGRAFLEGLAVGLGIWLLLWLLSRLLAAGGTPAGPVAALFMDPLRALIPTGALLLMGALVLRPVLGEAALGIGITCALVCPLAGLVTALLRLPEGALDPPKDDPSRLAEHCWRGGGLFYVNPEDSRLLVPKKDGGGWTYNFAHPRARAHMLRLGAILVGVPLAVALILVLIP